MSVSRALVPRGAGGYTYLWLLFAVAGMGTLLSVIGTVWHTDSMRERERELLFAGNQIRRAIATYYEESPGGVKQYPESLEDLLEDKRYPTLRRHLRRLYRDPITGGSEWGLVKTPDGARIMGVFSTSEKSPVKKAGFEARFAGFAAAQRYSDWKFAHSAGQGTGDGETRVAGNEPPQTPSTVETVGLTTLPTSSPARSGGGTVVTAPPPEPPKPKSQCEKIAESDQLACDRMGQRFDNNTKLECMQSAQQRAQACAQGNTVLPGLYVRYF